MSTIVKFAPSSGHAIGAHLRLCLLWAVEQSYLPRPRRHVPTFYPGDGTGMLPFGRPYCSTCTLTADRGGKCPSHIRVRGGNSPSLVVIVADEATLTMVSTDEFSGSLMLSRPKDVARGFVLGPLTEGRGLSSIPSRYWPTWATDRKPTSPYLQSCRRTLPYALWLQHKTSAGSRPIVDFIISLSDECRD